MKKYFTLKNLGLILTSMVIFLLGISGFSKVFATDEMIKNFEFMNLTPYMALIGVMEIISVSLLLSPKTSIYGTIFISLIMSGAVAIHLSLMGGVGLFTPIFILLSSWLGYFLRTHEICKEL
jgi:hypothetical protein